MAVEMVMSSGNPMAEHRSSVNSFSEILGSSRDWLWACRNHRALGLLLLCDSRLEDSRLLCDDSLVDMTRRLYTYHRNRHIED